MNKIKSYILGAAALLAIAGSVSSCQDHFDAPDMDMAPVASMTANTSILEVKEWLWQNGLNYCDTVYTRDYYLGLTADPWEGEHVIISGRVLSSDYAGNCFKYIILQDETGALNFSINSYNLYLEYRRGQEIVVDLTGMFMGKYRGLEQVGFPSWNSSQNDYETSFLGPELFNRQRELNGMPDVAKLDTLIISSFSELGTSPSELRRWQSQLIRINNVTFEQSSDAAAEGITTLSTYHSSGVTQNVVASDGSTGAVRTSGYANFWNMELPEGPVDVVMLVGYYGSTESNAAYQFTLIDASGIITDPTVPKGSKDNPYTIGEAIDLQAGSTVTTAWVEGYLVGTVAPEVTEVNSNEDVEWTADPILPETMVIGPTPDCTDVAQCLVIELTQGTALYNQSILAKPSNYKKLIAINGRFEEVMGNTGVVTEGSKADYLIEGQSDNVVGDGSEENPYSCAQVIKMAPQSTTDAVESGVWMTGYIVGYYNEYAPHFETAGAVTTNILMSDTRDAATATQCVSVQLPLGDVRTALNLANNPQLLGVEVAVYGDVMKYNTLPGIKNTSKYAFGGEIPGPGETPSPGDGSGDGTEASPYDCASIINMNPQSTTEAVESGVWMTGYIVGYYNDFAPHFEIAGAVTTNILMSDTRDAATATQCVSVQLPFGDVRTALNLADNPGLLGKKVSVYGDVMKYNTLPGIKNTSKYALDGEIPGPGETPSPGDGSGSGTEASPYDCASIINMNPQSTTDAVKSGVWVEGYVVGYYAEFAGHFETAGAVNANILMADTPTASSTASTICIQLPFGDVRTALNLADNPGLFGQKVSVYGDVMKYNTLPGIKNTSKYKKDGATGGGSTDTPPTPEGVITVAQALQYINSGSIPSGEVQVKGIITSITEVSTSYGNATYIIKDKTSDANGLTIFRSSWLNGEKYTSESQIQVGAEVIVQGTLVLYGGKTPEMNGGKMISYNGQTGSGSGSGGGTTPSEPDTPTEPGKPGTVVFNFTAPASLTPAYPATAGSKQDNGNTYEAVSNVKFTDNGVSVSATKGNSTDARIYYQSSGAIQYRIYNGATLTISSSLPIKTIEFEFTNANSKLVSGGTTYDRSNPTVSAGGTTSMGFTCSATVQINKITVVTE